MLDVGRFLGYTLIISFSPWVQRESQFLCVLGFFSFHVYMYVCMYVLTEFYYVDKWSHTHREPPDFWD